MPKDYLGILLMPSVPVFKDNLIEIQKSPAFKPGLNVELRKKCFTCGYLKRKGDFMPEFGTPFAGLAKDRKLTKEELIRAVRFMIAAEYEAIQLYMQLAESTDNKLAQEVLKDIADEEKVHAGEFLRLLKELAPDEQKFYDEGAEEVEEEIGK